MAYSQPFPLAAPQVQKVQAPSYGPDLSVRLICPDGDLVCRNCGLVLGDRIVDTRSEWRTFANDEGDDPSRVGAASDPLMEGREQLDTVVSFRDGGSGMARELQRAASRAQSSRAERNLLTAFRDISSWCDQFSLPKTIATSRSIVQALRRGEAFAREPLDAVIAACIFIACRQAHVPRTFREICNLTHVSKKILGQCYKALEQAFNLTPGASATTTTPSRRPSICSDIIVEARKHGIADGRSPVSIAGGAIYFTCNLLGKTKSLRDISAVAGVSEGTIKLVYRLYYHDKEKLVKKEWIEDGKADLARLPFEAPR
ncbi:hypothetical protein B0H13DRAFT_2236313 [Mycena leptocephala]|nr:hypothetical protein B0H13DRAFT_2236313 [Mycena leptocephala]